MRGLPILLALLNTAVGPGTGQASALQSEATTPPASGARVDEAGDLSDPALLEAFLDGLIQGQLRERSIAGATLAVVSGGEVLFTKGYGWADVDARRPVDPEETLFRIASVTKLFTYTAVMQLVEEGRLDLEADVNEYLDFRIPDTYPEPITLTHLMTHTAGFEEDLRNLFTFDPEQVGRLEDWVKENLPLRVRPPGTFSVYSNYGTALAGYIVERASGLAWEDYIERRILEPLGMDRTTGREPLPEALALDLSQGYAPRKGGFEPQPLELNPGGAPAGSMSSTAADMATFMLAFLGGGAVGEARILEEATAARMLQRHFGHDPRLPGNGLGFFEMSSHGERILGHGGNTQWFHNVLALFPEHDLGLFVSFNTTTAAPLTYGPFLTTFLDRFFPGSTPSTISSAAEAAGSAETAELARLAGHYRFNRMSYTTFQKAMGLVMTMKVSAEDDVLIVDSPLGPMRLVQIEPLRFREELGHTEVVIRTDDRGRSTHAFVSLVPMMAAERVPWHGAPPLHFALLGGGLLMFLAILVAAPVGWFRRWRAEREDAEPVALSRRALLAAAAAHVGFVVMVLAMAAPDPFAFLSTPMTGFALALALPVVGLLATGVAGWATWQQWRRGTGSRWSRIWTSGLVTVALLFAWSLHYWNLLGWRL
ncbi:MAG: class A beta-lactamase-related serine hydrolase [Gemmatimonadales bacterium]|nr:MAG: class A beta-lactamase-related serine hydrolase [Gemmatimonadales bacterium]